MFYTKNRLKGEKSRHPTDKPPTSDNLPPREACVQAQYHIFSQMARTVALGRSPWLVLT